jgi:hypothetical protein
MRLGATSLVDDDCLYCPGFSIRMSNRKIAVVSFKNFSDINIIDRRIISVITKTVDRHVLRHLLQLGNQLSYGHV